MWHAPFTCDATYSRVSWLTRARSLTLASCESSPASKASSNPATHVHMGHDSFTYVTWLIHICDMTHSYVTVFILPAINASSNPGMRVRMGYFSFTYMTRRIHIYDMTHSYVPIHMRHDLFIYVTWLNHIYDMAHTYVSIYMSPASKAASNPAMRVRGYDSFTYVTWLIETWGAGVDILAVYTHFSLFHCQTQFFVWFVPIKYRYLTPNKWYITRLNRESWYQSCCNRHLRPPLMRFFVFVSFLKWYTTFVVFVDLYPRPPRLDSFICAIRLAHMCLYICC